MDVESLRISIIGNKDLKHKLTKDETFISSLIDRMAGDLDNSAMVINCLTILKYLTRFDSKVLEYEAFVRLNGLLVEIVDRFTKYLITNSNQQMFELSQTNFQIISNSIELLNIISIKQFNFKVLKFIMVLLNVSYVPDESRYLDQLVSQCTDLIPLVLNEDVERLIVDKLMERVDFETHQNHLNINLIYRLMLNLNFVLSQELISKYGFELLDSLKSGLSELIKHENELLNLNIINFLYLFERDFESEEEPVSTLTHKRDVDYINKLIELIEVNQYSINPFKILSNLILKNDALVLELIKFKIDLKLTNYLKVNLKTYKLSKLIEINLADILLLISLLTHTNDELREKFVEKFNFKMLLKKLCTYYKAYLIKLAKKVSANELQGNDKVLKLVNHKIFVNCFNLIRSLSRSIILLRTFFLDLNIVSTLSEILGLLEALKLHTEIKPIILSICANLILDFSSFRYNLISNEKFLHTLTKLYEDKKSPSEDPLFQENVNLIFLQILKNLMYNENEENKVHLIESHFPMEILLDYITYNQVEDGSELHRLKLKQKLTSFDIIRNLSSNSKYFNHFLSLFFSSHLNISWYNFLIMNIINLSNFDSECKTFSSANLVKMISNDDYVSMLLSINYIENHRILTINDLHLNKNFLVLWLIFLNLMPVKNDTKLSKAGALKFSQNLNSVKLSIIWILLNLTWRQDKRFDIFLFTDSNQLDFNTNRDLTQDINFDEFMSSSLDSVEPHSDSINLSGIVDRAKFLTQFGFIDSLRKFKDSLMVESYMYQLKADGFTINDLIEKSNAVMYQVDCILNGKPNRPSQIQGLRKPEVPKPEEPLGPDVNRGGEGFGYDSDDYVDAEDIEVAEDDAEDTNERRSESESDAEYDSDYYRTSLRWR